MSKIKLDLAKFKKVHADKNSTTLKHEAGHEIRINHNALSPENKQHLDSLPVHGKKQKSSKEDPTAQHLMPGDQMPNKIEKNVVRTAKIKMADGGDVPTAGNPDEDSIYMSQAAPKQGPVDFSPEGQGEELPAQMSSGPGNTPAPVATSPSAAAPAAPSAEEDDSEDAPPSPAAAAQTPASQVGVPAPVSPNAPDVETAYKNQSQGVKETAKALGDLGRQQAAIQSNAAANEQKALQNFQDTNKQLMEERQHLLDDIKNSHIDPKRLYANASTGQKVSSAIGLVLGGLGGAMSGQGGNSALDFLNKQIDRDIDAQKADLGKKNTLLSANYQKFGDMAQATTMTKVMMADIVKDQLGAAAAKAQSPLEQARAKQLQGQIDQGMAPAFQSLATMRALSGGGTAGHDPSAYVKFVVPEARQPEVFKEIERAQNTRNMGDTILKSFDQATKDNTAMKTGFGHLRTPASVLALHQSMQPTFQDLEGTVRQAAMDNTFHNITPQPGDMESTIATKRQALQDYLKSKASAPTAKGFGIDLDKFSSTTTDPVKKLPAQQQQYAQWAKSNPNDPRAKLVLKKLGLE